MNNRKLLGKQMLLGDPTVKYSYGPYNCVKGSEQWIRITEGCPHNCPYCYEPQEFKIFGIPEIVRNDVGIIDMNLLAKTESLQIIKDLGEILVNEKIVHYNMKCGIDYRFLTLEIAEAMKKSHFVPPVRIAWDWDLKQQYKIKDALKLLLKVGYKRKGIQIFMICNWRISYSENCKKLDLCKVWGVQIDDNYFDNQQPPNVLPIHWMRKEIKDFCARVKLHNQMINFEIYPDLKRVGRYRHEAK